jgi:hypothetical protein
VWVLPLLLCLYLHRTTTARVLTYQILTNPSDTIIAIYNATAGGSSIYSSIGNGIGEYPSNQGPSACIDFSNTTCLNFGNVGQNLTGATNTAGVGTGVYTVPGIGASILVSVQFETTNGSANRDPLTITLEGTNATGTDLSMGYSWTLLYNGMTGLSLLSSNRLTWGDLQNFSNTQTFTTYRMLITSQRGVDDCTEFTEMHLYGLV